MKIFTISTINIISTITISKILINGGVLTRSGGGGFFEADLTNSPSPLIWHLRVHFAFWDIVLMNEWNLLSIQIIFPHKADVQQKSGSQVKAESCQNGSSNLLRRLKST